FGRGNNGWVMVDGISTTSPDNNTAFQNTFSYDTIQEASVTTLGNSAEAPNSGMQVNLIIKSGSNEFHGEGTYTRTPKSWQGNNVDTALKAQNIPDPQTFSNRWDIGGDVGGRIKRDRIWGYFSARERDETSNVLGGPPFPDGTPDTFS